MANLTKGFGFNVATTDSDTNTNLGNANLTADNTARKYTVASGGAVTFNANDGTQTAKFNDSGVLLIGASSTSYAMPTDQGTNQQILQTDGSGTASWQNEIERIDWQAYNNAMDSANYFYANAMTDNKYKALCNQDLGSAAIEGGLTVAQAIRGGYYVADRSCRVRSIVGWGTSTSAEVCTLAIIKLTPEDGGSDSLTPVEVASGTFTGGTNNNVAKSVTGSLEAVEIASGDILMPMIKVANLEEAVGTYFNITFTLY